MYRNLVVVLCALGYLGSSDAIHPASEPFVGSPNLLLSNDLSLEKITTSVQQAGPEFVAITNAFIEKALPKLQQRDENCLAAKLIAEGKALLEFFKLLSNSEAGADPSKQQALLQAISERVSKCKADPTSGVGQQLVGAATIGISGAGEEVVADFKEYLPKALDKVQDYPSNVIFKNLAKLDLLLSFYEKTGGMSPVSAEDQELAADIPVILCGLTAEYGLVSDLVALFKNTGN